MKLNTVPLCFDGYYNKSTQIGWLNQQEDIFLQM